MAHNEENSTPRGRAAAEEPRQNANVWVFAEHRDGKPEDFCYPVAGEGRILADRLGEELWIVALGSAVRQMAERFGPYGADRLLAVEDPLLEKYSSYGYVDAMAHLAEAHRPSLILFPATPISGDLAPRLAARIRVGLASRYTQIEIDSEGRLLVHRPIHGGRAQATLAAMRKPLVATVSPQSLTQPKPKAGCTCEVVKGKIRIDPKMSRTKVIDYLKADPCAVCVSEAEIVIGVGKGLGGAENLAAVDDLAHVLGASVGGSRRATDENWVADERRIGLTGKTIAPRLYLLCGISGAFHHTLSIKSSQMMVSINTDPNAPINKLVDLAIAGDMQEVIPELTRQLSELRASDG
jgi:electron transfer flavoprotein alpha subunit